MLTTADTLRTVAERLRQDPTTEMAADFAERGAAVIENVGTYLESTPLDRMISDAERFSRERPLLVAAAGLTVGMLASRLVKSTAARRQMQ